MWPIFELTVDHQGELTVDHQGVSLQLTTKEKGCALGAQNIRIEEKIEEISRHEWTSLF